MQKRSRFLVPTVTLGIAVFSGPAFSAGTLVAHYEFEDPANLGHDSSGMDNHATPTNVTAVEGMFGGGAFFRESQGSLMVKSGGLAGFTGKPGTTLAAWVKLDPTASGYDGIISQDPGACCQNRILLSPDRYPFINLSEHSDRHLTGAPQFPFDVWMHIAMTGEDFGGNSLARVYVNGVEVQGSPQAFPLAEDASNWNTYLGAGEAGNVHRLTGTLDDVRIYQGTLSGEEILGLLDPSPPARPQLSFSHDPDTGELRISWDSQGGALYNLRSETDLSVPEPATWPLFGSHAGLEATPPQNTLTIPRPADPTRFFVVEAFPAPPETIFTDDFESGLGEWTVGSDGAAGTAWELGTPTTGPLAAHSGVNCFGTNLHADYTNNANVWLRSPPIDLTGAGNATLSFQQYVDIEDNFHSGTVSLLDPADNSVLVVVHTVDGFSGDWQSVSKAIPSEALGRTIRVEFRLQTDALGVYPGFYIDDVVVTVP